MKRRSTISLVFYSMFLFAGISLINLSCTDHTEPVNPSITRIKTLDAKHTVVFGANVLVYGAQFETFGSSPVMEYGIVRIVGPENATSSIPTVTDTKFVITDPVTTEERSKAEAFFLPERNRVFYRAYAILQNGDVIYGEVKSRFNTPD